MNLPFQRESARTSFPLYSLISSVIAPVSASLRAFSAAALPALDPTATHTTHPPKPSTITPPMMSSTLPALIPRLGGGCGYGPCGYCGAFCIASSKPHSPFRWGRAVNQAPELHLNRLSTEPPDVRCSQPQTETVGEVHHGRPAATGSPPRTSSVRPA